jgi:hypothetical protein
MESEARVPPQSECGPTAWRHRRRRHLSKGRSAEVLRRPSLSGAEHDPTNRLGGGAQLPAANRRSHSASDFDGRFSIGLVATRPFAYQPFADQPI